MFILDKSDGFTQAGVVRLNDSIRTYVWAILGAQAQTRSNILKVGTGFDAQKQFTANLEDAIASPVDIPSSIDRYQKTLQYASTPLDYVCGRALYLMPSDMALHPGNVQGYNNQIQIAGSDAAIGHNPGINKAALIQPASKVDRTFQGKTASPAGTDPRVLAGPPPEGSPTSAAVAPPADWKSGLDHEEEKTALIVAGIGVGLVVLWLVAR